MWCKEHGQAFCSKVRWEIGTHSKVPLGFGRNANETTAGVKKSAENSLNWYCNMVTKHLLLVVSNELQAKLHLNDHLYDEFPPNPSHRQIRAFANVGKGECSGSPWHCLCQPAPWWPNSTSCRQDPALGAVGRLRPYLLKTSCPPKDKGLAGFAKDIPNHSPPSFQPHLYTTRRRCCRVNSWFWNPQDFQAKGPMAVAGIALCSSPCFYLVWEQTGTNSLCKGTLSLLAGNREG